MNREESCTKNAMVSMIQSEKESVFSLFETNEIGALRSICIDANETKANDSNWIMSMIHEASALLLASFLVKRNTLENKIKNLTIFQKEALLEKLADYWDDGLNNFYSVTMKKQMLKAENNAIPILEESLVIDEMVHKFTKLKNETKENTYKNALELIKNEIDTNSKITKFINYVFTVYGE